MADSARREAAWLGRLLEELPPRAGPCGLAWGRCAGVPLRWVYEERWGRWFLRDKAAARVLGWSTRELNRRAVRMGDGLPGDFAHRMTDGRFHFAFPHDRARPRRGGRPPWVYSLPGLLLLRLRAGEDATALVRLVADLLDAQPGPLPPSLRLPRSPRHRVDAGSLRESWST